MIAVSVGIAIRIITVVIAIVAGTVIVVAVVFGMMKVRMFYYYPYSFLLFGYNMYTIFWLVAVGMIYARWL